MSKRFDNKRLLYIVGGLVIIMLLTIFIRVPKENATLKAKLVEFDTLSVSKIIIYPKLLKDKPVEFIRNNGKWSVQQGSVIAEPRNGAVGNIISEVLSMKPQNLAAVSKSKWKEFELTDSLATRISFLNKKGNILADLMVGKASYKQVASPYGGYGGSNIQGTSYVRLFNEKEIYGVDGFASYSLTGNFNDWRDKTFIRLKKDDITNISFTYPADSSFKLIKKDLKWMIGSQSADSSTTANFISELASLDGQDIKDNFKPVLNPVYQMQISGNNLLNINVKCYAGSDSQEYILNSSLNAELYYSSKNDGLFAKVFRSPGYFLKKSGK
jgi:hypothetical protein